MIDLVEAKLRWQNAPYVMDIIAEVERLTKERDELKPYELASPFKDAKIKEIEVENAEWVAKSHAWLTASMVQDDEIATLKASLEASEKKVREWEIDFIKEDWRHS